MFILYVNEIPELVSSTVKIFADDTKLYAATSDSKLLQDDLNALASSADVWNCHLMSTNAKLFILDITTQKISMLCK